MLSYKLIKKQYFKFQKSTISMAPSSSNPVWQIVETLIMATYRNEQANNDEDVLAEIKKQLAQIQFGSLEIQIHNGQVVQFERREKKRWGKSENAK